VGSILKAGFHKMNELAGKGVKGISKKQAGNKGQ
jgi:hypothetical protein